MTHMALELRTVDLHTSEAIIDTSEDARLAPPGRLSPGQSRALRTLIAAQQLKTKFPEAGIDGTVRRRPILNNIGVEPTPTQDVANFFTKLRYEEAEIGPPYAPYPAPKLMEEPWAPHITEV